MKKILLVILVATLTASAQNPNTPKFPGAAATDADLFVATDFAQTTLNGSILSGATSMVLTSGVGFAAPVVVLIDAELFHCATLATNTLSGCTGHQGNTTAASHSNMALVTNTVSAWHHNQLAAEIKSVETWAVSNAGGYGTSGGTANAQTVTLSPAITSLTTGLTVCWTPSANNTTTTPTLAVNGLTATTIVKTGGAALSAADLTTTAIACAKYDGSKFELQNPQTTSAGGTGAKVNQGPYSSLAGTAASTGDLYFFTGTGNLYTQAVATATNTWQVYAGPFPVTPPPTTGWTADNCSGCTWTFTYGYGYLTGSATGGAIQQLKAQYRTAPATPYTVTALVDIDTGGDGATSANVGCAIAFRESSTGKYVDSDWSSYSATAPWVLYQSVKYTTAATYAGSFYQSILNTNLNGVFYRKPLWMIATDDGTNLTFYYSVDGGATKVQMGASQSRTNYMSGGPNQVAFATFSASNGTPVCRLLSWTVQ